MQNPFYGISLFSPREPASSRVLCPTRPKMLLAKEAGAQVKLCLPVGQKPGWNPLLKIQISQLRLRTKRQRPDLCFLRLVVIVTKSCSCELPWSCEILNNASPIILSSKDQVRNWLRWSEFLQLLLSDRIHLLYQLQKMETFVLSVIQVHQRWFGVLESSGSID